jgi:hypothetical protein
MTSSTMVILLLRSIIILIAFVLASRNIVAYAFATSASFAIHRNRHFIISSVLPPTAPLFGNGGDSIRNDDTVVSTTRLFSSLTTAALPSAASEETDNKNKGPWWTRIRIGNGNNHRRGRGGKRVKAVQTQVDDYNSAGASKGATSLSSRPSPKLWPRLLPTNMKQLPKLFTSFLTNKEKQPQDSRVVVRHDNDITSEGRRKLFPLMLLPVLGLRSKEEEKNSHRSNTVVHNNNITPLLSTVGIAKCGYTTAAEQQSKLAIGMALSSVPTAMGRLWFQRRRKLNHHHQSQTMIRHIDRNDSFVSTTITNDSASKALSSRGGGSTATAFINDNTATSYYVVNTPLFPVYVPEEISTTADESSSTLDISVATTTTTLSTATVIPTDDATATAATTTSLMQAMTRPLLTKELLTSSQLTGRELYHPTSMEALAQTGLEICSWGATYIQWTGERKADKFFEDHHPHTTTTNNQQSGDSSDLSMVDWYDALDTSQEVLTWVGKFIPSKLSPLSSSSSSSTTENNGVSNYYGAELPVIKTISIIHHSPSYLANILMDSTKVKAYNKMSIGRSDIHVFQKGIDTINGPFGDGETKVVRNLTKPPIVSGIVEFVTCMHARKLRVEDVKILSSSSSSTKSNLDDEIVVNDDAGYIVVSRAIVGGSSHLFDNTSDGNSGEKLVRNEILLGVNVLRAIPGQPNKTELTSVTHVYSPMIPLLLAKSAGVKGATDFVRDIRALPRP